MVYCKEDSCIKQADSGSDFCSENCKTKALANKPSSNQFVAAPRQLLVAAPPRQLLVAAPLTQPLVAAPLTQFVAAPLTQFVAAPRQPLATLTVANIKSINEFINAVTLGKRYPPENEFLVKTYAILSSLLKCRETYATAKKQQCIDEIILAMNNIFIHFYGSASTSESVVYAKKIYTLEVAAAVYSMTRTLSAANIFGAQGKFIRVLEPAIKSVAGGKTENVSLPDKVLLNAYFAAIVAAIDKKIPSSDLPEEKKVKKEGGGVMKFVKLLVAATAVGGGAAVGYGYGLTHGGPVGFATGYAAGQTFCSSSSPSQNISLSCNYNQAAAVPPTFTPQDYSALEAVPTNFISEIVNTVASGLAHVSGKALVDTLLSWGERLAPLALGTKLI